MEDSVKLPSIQRRLLAAASQHGDGALKRPDIDAAPRSTANVGPDGRRPLHDPKLTSRWRA
jgi:hypothetical protein